MYQFYNFKHYTIRNDINQQRNNCSKLKTFVSVTCYKKHLSLKLSLNPIVDRESNLFFIHAVITIFLYYRLSLQLPVPTQSIVIALLSAMKIFFLATNILFYSPVPLYQVYNSEYCFYAHLKGM
ncbi:hypothetical protein XELAEV_18041208mg [Xenopus laevis]|uniref:Uncharacterized protein n=1 Tax=Xenopus laevis TaxID=8355 RepID=A0A974H4Y0_XENLA|nr:hypothetical protein XELAEV_18041208mg [Xenopus laevis]